MREINEIGLVTAVGIDKAAKPYRYSVTIQIANPNVSNSSSTQGSSVWIATEEGDSIFDATRKLVGISSRRIMWAHNNVVIIGESLAREGIIPVIDYFTHQPELRMKAAVVVSKGDAKDYVAARAGMENPTGISFILLEGYRALSAESVESHMLDVASELANKYENPLISEISLKRAILQSKDSQPTGGKYAETIDMRGAAVFKKDRMLGWLTPKETLGAAWILNQTKDTVVTVIDPEHGNKSVSVETRNVKAKIKASVTDGMPNISINISGDGDIAEEGGVTGQGINEIKEHVADLVNQTIEKEIRDSLGVIQNKYMVDVLGLAMIVHVQNDREWESGLKDRWQEVFPIIPVSVSVDIKIRSSKLKQQPIRIF